MFYMLNAQKNSSFMKVLKVLIFYPMYVYGAIINFPIIFVQISDIVFPVKILGLHMTYFYGWFRKILLKLRKSI